MSNVKLKKVVDVKFALRAFSAVLGVVGVFLASNPVGWVILGVTALTTVVSLFIKGKDKQIDMAKDNLYESLKANVEKMRDKDKQ